MTLAGGLSAEATFADRGDGLLAGVRVCFAVLGLPDCFLACEATGLYNYCFLYTGSCYLVLPGRSA